MNKKGFLDDSNGNKSSKRLIGFILVGCGLAMKFTLFGWGLGHSFANPLTDLDGIADSLIYAGSAVLGVGVVEFFKKDKSDV